MIYGGAQDWNYVWHGGNDLTLEVSNNKWPLATQLPTFWAQNQESMLAYLDRVDEGIRGIVADPDCRPGRRRRVSPGRGPPRDDQPRSRVRRSDSLGRR